MRGRLPVRLSHHERGQLIAWSRSERQHSRVVRDSKMILGLDDGRSIVQVADGLGISRQTVSERRDRFIILGLDGIGESVPKLGRKHRIRQEKADEVLYVPLYEFPGDGPHWSTSRLARRCEVPYPTMHRFLKDHAVSLNDRKTIDKVIDCSSPRVLGVSGLFLSPSISVMAFCSRARSEPADAFGPTCATTFPMETSVAFLSRMSAHFLKLLGERKMELLYEFSKVPDFNHLLLFLKWLHDKTSDRKDILLVADTLEVDACGIMERWLDGHLRFHLETPLEAYEWTRRLGEYLGGAGQEYNGTIAFQLEHLTTRLTEWKDRPARGLGVFVSVIPTVMAIR